jgi:hypothetical protein
LIEGRGELEAATRSFASDDPVELSTAADLDPEV